MYGDEAAKKEVARQADQRAGKYETISTGAGLGAECSRMTGKAALMERVWRIRRQADMLEALARAIPDNFPADADAGLWEVVSKI